MTKTNVKTQMTIVQADPRKRMKEVRSLVAKAVKKNERLDLIDFSDEDRTRVILALQDQLTKTEDRHRKASNIVAEMKDDDMMADGFTSIVINGLQITMMEKIRHIDELTTALYVERDSHMKTAQALNMSHQDCFDLQVRLDTLKDAMKEFV